MSPLLGFSIALIAVVMVTAAGVGAEPAQAVATRPAYAVLTPAELSVQKDLRIVRDLARLDLGLVASERSLPWIVARLSDVQARQEQVGWLMGEDGRGRSAPDTAASRFFLEGRIEMLEVLTIPPEHPLIGYQEPMRQSHEVFDGEHRGGRYSPFLRTDGGIVICRVNDLYPGLSRFLPAFMIPPDWRKFVTPACRRYLRDPALFDPADAIKHQQQLIKLLDEDNPLVAAEACKTLTNGGAMDAAAARVVGRTTDPLRQALFTRILIGSGPPEARAERVNDLAKVVDAADTYRRVRGIALGALVTASDVSPTRTWEPLLPLVDRLTVRFGAARTPEDIDRHIQASLEGTTRAWRSSH